MQKMFAISAMAFGCGLILGCGGSDGSSKVTAKGQLLKAGQPLKIGNSVFSQMVFYSDTKDSKTYNSYSAMLNPDGTFEVANIPPGKYLIALELTGDAGDLCQGLFRKENSKLIREVNGKDAIRIEITKAKGE